MLDLNFEASAVEIYHPWRDPEHAGPAGPGSQTTGNLVTWMWGLYDNQSQQT
jgi:hypothetical protein